jgi:hypothetical protein
MVMMAAIPLPSTEKKKSFLQTIMCGLQKCIFFLKCHKSFFKILIFYCPQKMLKFCQLFGPIVVAFRNC